MATAAGDCSVMSRMIFAASTQRTYPRFRLIRRRVEAKEPCQKREIACNGQRLCCTRCDGRVTIKTSEPSGRRNAARHRILRRPLSQDLAGSRNAERICNHLITRNIVIPPRERVPFLLRTRLLGPCLGG